MLKNKPSFFDTNTAKLLKENSSFLLAISTASIALLTVYIRALFYTQLRIKLVYYKQEYETFSIQPTENMLYIVASLVILQLLLLIYTNITASIFDKILENKRFNHYVFSAFFNEIKEKSDEYRNRIQATKQNLRNSIYKVKDISVFLLTVKNLARLFYLKIEIKWEIIRIKKKIYREKRRLFKKYRFFYVRIVFLITIAYIFLYCIIDMISFSSYFSTFLGSIVTVILSLVGLSLFYKNKDRKCRKEIEDFVKKKAFSNEDSFEKEGSSSEDLFDKLNETVPIPMETKEEKIKLFIVQMIIILGIMFFAMVISTNIGLRNKRQYPLVKIDGYDYVVVMTHNEKELVLGCEIIDNKTLNINTTEYMTINQFDRVHTIGTFSDVRLLE
ncbi:MAG: hypothetical protein ACOX6O_04950 [Christensenellales bacterium]|jgi:hypothetical protein